MAATLTSRKIDISPVSVSEETFIAVLDNATFLDITPTQIKSIYGVTITPLSASASTNITSIYFEKFGGGGDFNLFDSKIRVTAGAGAFTGVTYLIALHGTTA